MRSLPSLLHHARVGAVVRRGYERGREHRRVDELFRRGGPSWVDYHVKDTTKGPVVWRVRATRFVPHAGNDRSEKWLLTAVNVLNGDTKYFLSNAPEETPISTLLTVAFTRWRVEHNFEESKQAAQRSARSLHMRTNWRDCGCILVRARSHRFGNMFLPQHASWRTEKVTL